MSKQTPHAAAAKENKDSNAKVKSITQVTSKVDPEYAQENDSSGSDHVPSAPPLEISHDVSRVESEQEGMAQEGSRDDPELLGLEKQLMCLGGAQMLPLFLQMAELSPRGIYSRALQKAGYLTDAEVERLKLGAPLSSGAVDRCVSV